MNAHVLAGRGAVVTGSGRGIGAAVAASLSAAGAKVVVSARTNAQIEQVAAELRDRGAAAWAVACDVTDEGSVRHLGETAAAHLGAVDILVNNAGVASSAPLARIALEEWNRVMAVNATGTFLCTRSMAPAMLERGWGRVVNVASTSGLEGAKYIPHYSAAKHAVVGFTRSMAREFEGRGVTSNAVCPGYVDTPMTQRTVANVQTRAGLSSDQALQAVLASAAQDRLVTTEEVADAVVKLCDDASREVNGQTLVLNGSASTMPFEIINPERLGAPKGWNNGLIAPRGSRMLFVAGQAGWEDGAEGEAPGFADQFARALDKVLAVVAAAGAQPNHVARLTLYVTDVAQYRDARRELGEIWRERFGKFYPAMALVEVKGLVDRGALIEMEATAILGGVH